MCFSVESCLQFVVYGGYWIAIGVIFLSIFCVSVIRLDGNGSYVQRCRTEGLWRNNLRYCMTSSLYTG